MGNCSVSPPFLYLLKCFLNCPRICENSNRPRFRKIPQTLMFMVRKSFHMYILGYLGCVPGVCRNCLKSGSSTTHPWKGTMNWKGDTSSFMFCMFPLSPHSSPDLWHLFPFLDVIHHFFFEKNATKQDYTLDASGCGPRGVASRGSRGWQAVKRDQGAVFFRYANLQSK